MSEALLDELQDWVYYRDAHPDSANTPQWGMELLHKIASELISDYAEDAH